MHSATGFPQNPRNLHGVLPRPQRAHRECQRRARSPPNANRAYDRRLRNTAAFRHVEVGGQGLHRGSQDQYQLDSARSRWRVLGSFLLGLASCGLYSVTSNEEINEAVDGGSSVRFAAESSASWPTYCPRYPLAPHVHLGPAGSTHVCPNSPAQKCFPSNSVPSSIIAEPTPTSDERKGRCHEIQIGLGAEYIEANAAESASSGTLKAL